MTSAAPQSLTGHVAIVTGAGKGLGRAYALRFAAAGAAVVVNNRPPRDGAPDSAAAMVAAIRAAGGRAVANHDPVEDPASGDRMVAQALDAFGRLDILVNNAGVPEARTFHRATLDAFRAVFDINFLGTLHPTHAAFRHMRAAGYGRILVSTSSAGLHGNHGMAAYSASKAAVIGLMRALALEGKDHGVLVNAIAPYAATAMTADHLPPALVARMDPARVASVAAWLVAPDCAVTGRIVVAGGGRARAALMVEGDGVAIDGGELTPALLDRHAAALFDMAGARGLPDATSAFHDFIGNDRARRLAADDGAATGGDDT